VFEAATPALHTVLQPCGNVPSFAKQKCPTWALRGAKPDSAEISDIAGPAGLAVCNALAIVQ
jgi:hypothetical protein